MERRTQRRLKKADLSFIDEVASKFEDERVDHNNTDIRVEEVDSLHGLQDSINYRTISEKGRTLISELDPLTVSECVDSYEYLTKKGIVSNLGKKVFIYILGSSKDGVYYFVLYGHAYCKIQVPSEKMLVSQTMKTLVMTILTQ